MPTTLILIVHVPLAEPYTRRIHVATRVLWALVAGLLGLYLVVFLAWALSRVARPYEEFMYAESWLLDGARRVANGEPLYAPADQVPIMHTAYTPIYYLVVGELMKIFGDSGYTLGRAVSLLATLAGAAAMVFAVRKMSGHTWCGLLAASLLLTQNLTVLLWAPLNRSDALALSFTLVGLALATYNKTLPAAGVFVLAAMTKQSFLVAPLAVAVSLYPRWRSMLRFAVVFGVGLAASVAAAQVASSGWFLWHTVVGNSNEAEFDTFAQLMGSFLQFNGLPVLAAAASLLLPAGCQTERPWRLYFLASLFTLATIAKIGASSNYWLEITAATSVLVALAASRLAREPTARLLAPTMIAGALFVALPAYQASARDAADGLGETVWRSPAYLSLVSDVGTAPFRVEATFVKQIAAEPGELLTDNPGLAVAAGKPIAYEFQIFQLLHVEGHWSQAPILDAIHDQRFSLVALMHPLDGPTLGTRWTPTIRDALLSAYKPDGARSGFWLYRPLR